MARVLVIDDDSNLLQMLGLMLKRAGHTPVLASSGREGIQIATQSPPDLAIVDVMMPSMSGHDVCRQLRAHPATVDLPILILTARAQAADRATALESGATDFMTKPVSPNELEAKLVEIFSQRERTQRGRIVTVISLRGGVGVTTVAVNLAGALRNLRVPNITLVDLSPNSGHVALQMRVQPRRNWSPLLQLTDPTADEIRSLLVSHPSGINLLAAPINPMYGVGLSERQFGKVCETLVSRAKFLIIDAPPVLDSACVGALKRADLVLLVLTSEIATIQSTSATLRALVQLGVSGRKVHLLLNSTADEAEIPKAAVERGLKRSISFIVPFDAAQTRALAQGEPLAISDPESPLPTAMERVASALLKAG